MNIDIDTIISNKFPHLDSVGKSGTIFTYDDKYLEYTLDTEHPLFMLLTHRFIESNSDVYNYKKDRYNNPITGYIMYRRPSLKVLNKNFYSVFRNSHVLKPYKIANNIFYIGKGVIMDSLLNPLVLTTYYLTQNDIDTINAEYKSAIAKKRYFDVSYDSNLDPSKIKIYLNRTIFTNKFKEDNKRLHKELSQVIIPQLMELDVPILVKRELDIFKNTYTDPNLRDKDLQNKYKIEVADAFSTLLTRLQ